MMTTPKIDAKKRSFFQDRKMWFWIAAGCGVLTLIVLVIFLQSLVSTTKYYVLNTNIPARTLITTSMLQEEVVSSGGQPPTAYSLSDVASNQLYSKTELHAGDILTSSNAGDLIPLRQGIPSSFVVTSFSANPNDAAGGNVKRGDYVDVFYVGDTGANLLLQRVLVLDTTTDLSQGNSNSSSNSSQSSGSGATTTGGSGSAATSSNSAVSAYRNGIPSLYTIGVSQSDALKLAAASKGKFYVVLSSADEVTKGATPQTLGMSLNDALNAPAGDSGAGTDSSFGSAKTSSTKTPSTAPSAAPSSAPSSAAASPAPSASTSSNGQ